MKIRRKSKDLEASSIEDSETGNQSSVDRGMDRKRFLNVSAATTISTIFGTLCSNAETLPSDLPGTLSSLVKESWGNERHGELLAHVLMLKLNDNQQLHKQAARLIKKDLKNLKTEFGGVIHLDKPNNLFEETSSANPINNYMNFSMQSKMTKISNNPLCYSFHIHALDENDIFPPATKKPSIMDFDYFNKYGGKPQVLIYENEGNPEFNVYMLDHNNKLVSYRIYLTEKGWETERMVAFEIKYCSAPTELSVAADKYGNTPSGKNKADIAKNSGLMPEIKPDDPLEYLYWQVVNIRLGNYTFEFTKENIDQAQQFLKKNEADFREEAEQLLALSKKLESINCLNIPNPPLTPDFPQHLVTLKLKIFKAIENAEKKGFYLNKLNTQGRLQNPRIEINDYQELGMLLLYFDAVENGNRGVIQQFHSDIVSMLVK